MLIKNIPRIGPALFSFNKSIETTSDLSIASIIR